MTSHRLQAYQDDLNAADGIDRPIAQQLRHGGHNYGCAHRVRSARPAIFTALLVGLLAISGGVYVLALRSCDAAISGPVWIP